MSLLKIKMGAWIAPICLLASSFAVADTKMVLNYDGFFDRIEKLDEPEFTSVKLAFYLKQLSDGQVCPIKNVTLKTKLKEKPVYFYDTGEVVLPYDKQLDLDKAKVIIDKDTLEECGLDMRLESTELFQSEVSTSRITKLTSQFDGALESLAGMMAFLTPDVVGVTFLATPADELKVVNSKVGQCKSNRCTITIKEIEQVDTVLFNLAPVKALPYIAK